jgi:hypothetical protein
MKTTSFEDTGKEDEFVNGYSGGTKNDPIVFEDDEDDYYVNKNNEGDSEEYYPDERPFKESKQSSSLDIGEYDPYKRPEDYDLLSPDEQDEYDALTDKHPWRLYKILGKDWTDVLDKRAEEHKKKYLEDEKLKEKILEHKEILTDPTYKGSKARKKVRQIYTTGMQGSDEVDEDAILNETAFKKYILGRNITNIPIDSLLSKEKQFAPADITRETRGGNVKSLIELKTVNYKPLSENHPKPKFWCPINKIANLYGYPEGIKNEPDNWDRIKEVKSFKNAPSKTERKLYWTVINRDEGEKVEDFIFPEEIKNKPIKAKNAFKNRLNYVDLNDKELKKDVLKYLKDKTYKPDASKPYEFKMSPVEKNKQMSIYFKNPKKLTDKKVHKTRHEYDMENVGFID